MNCPYCDALNDDQNSFCVSCGETIGQNFDTQADIPPPTQFIDSGSVDSPSSVDTAYPPPKPTAPVGYNPEFPGINSPIPPSPPPRSGRGLLYAGLTAIIVLVLAGAGIGGYFIWKNQQETAAAEVLPDHLGMFVQNKDRNGLAEIRKLDVVNAIEEKDKLLSDGNLPVWEKNSSLILYAEANDVPVTDLKLIPLESIQPDGKIKEMDFQAAPIEGKRAMKRLRLPEAVADGKYAFAILDGFLDEGKHKFWAFQVKGTGASDNSGLTKEATVALKQPADESKEKEEKDPKTEETAQKQTPQMPPPKKETKVEPPLGARVAYCNGSNVVLRATPSLEGRKIGSLGRGQRLYVLQYSKNYDNWRGTVANWAYVQTENGGRGWVFTPFVNY
ncbi:MAG: SH3 domain-containing protein [Pyrinomonadaceae bacterium]